MILGLSGVSAWLAPMYGKVWECVKSDSIGVLASLRLGSKENLVYEKEIILKFCS